jgi:predicted ArsR family transcriptional regulator
MKSTRDRILQTLLNNPNSTINDLASAVDINSISVRHHLTNLQADGLVTAQEVRHGVGRPRLVYALTETGAEKFPTRYLKLVNLLFFKLKDKLSPEELRLLLSQVAKEIAGDQAKKLRSLSVEERLNELQKYLSNEGFTLEWEKEGNSYVIKEIACPFYHINNEHPEVCKIDEEIISTLLSSPIKKGKCVVKGDTYCSYIFEVKEKSESSL